MRSVDRVHSHLVVALLAVLALVLVPVQRAEAAGADQVVDCATDSLQDAITAASPGDSIEVLPGTCFENVIIDRDITITGTYGQSIIDADGSGTTVTIDSSTDVHLDGLVITGGSDSGVISHGTTEISNTIVTGNSNFGGNLPAGGVANVGPAADMIVRDSIISDNTSDECGGFRNGDSFFPVVGEANALISNTLVTGNTGFVGGICNGDPISTQDDFAFLTIEDSTITGNTGFGLGSSGDGRPFLTVTRTAVTGECRWRSRGLLHRFRHSRQPRGG